MTLSVEPYQLINFIDHILRIDENGNFIPVIDEKTGKQKVNPITSALEWIALQEGTRHSAKIMGHLDENIEMNRNYITQIKNELRRIQALLEIDGRVPGNSGAFYDLLEGSYSRVVRLLDSATLLDAVSAGVTQIEVDDGLAFENTIQVTIYDDENSEEVLISSTNGNTITIQELTNNYKKGAKIARSNVAIADERMSFGQWGTYSISVSEVV